MRPLLHFTPPANWLNDPNGLVYYAGKYHLFYQYHPHSLDWGPMHWGHATSANLLDWEHQPTALAPDENGMIFSGSAVVDWRNTAGFGAEALAAIFTHHLEPGHLESQSLAFSLDQGQTWQKYSGNPALPNPGLRDFRDPKVFWHNDHWVMCLAAGREIRFYASPNLKDWNFSGVFALKNEPLNGVWETPDLFPLPVAGTNPIRWVLTLSQSAEAPAGGSGSRCCIGYFDGSTFQAESTHWLDYGPDFYAPQSWSDTPDGRRITLGWMSNWQYARQTPAPGGWRGMFSLPRELRLVTTENGPRLAQQPIAEVSQRRRLIFSHQQFTLQPGKSLQSDLPFSAWEVEVEPGAAPRFGCQIRYPGGASAEIWFDYEKQFLSLNRSSLHPQSGAVLSAPLRPGRLRLLVDTASIEIFAANGLVTFSAGIFPPEGRPRLKIFSQTTANFCQLQLFEILSETL